MSGDIGIVCQSSDWARRFGARRTWLQPVRLLPADRLRFLFLLLESRLFALLQRQERTRVFARAKFGASATPSGRSIWTIRIFAYRN
jgi:hypothetical protein